MLHIFLGSESAVWLSTFLSAIVQLEVRFIIGTLQPYGSGHCTQCQVEIVLFNLCSFEGFSESVTKRALLVLTLYVTCMNICNV